jgi:hypothetical protein
MSTAWPLIATLGTRCGTRSDVRCAWLSNDGSVAWLFDHEEWLHRVDLRASTRRSWRVFERGDTGELSALVAGDDRPFLWVCWGESNSEESTARVFELREEGAALRRTLSLACSPWPGLNEARARCSAVLVRREGEPPSASIYTPDGTLLAEPSADVLAATRRGYWAREGDLFEFCSHDGRRVYSEVVEESNDFIVAGAIEETTLALTLPDEIWLLDAETRSVRRVPSPLHLERNPSREHQRRLWHHWHRSGLCALHFGPDQPRSRFAVQRWEHEQVEPIPLGETERLLWLDERWILGATRGHCSLYDRGTRTLTTSDCPPVASIAMSDARRPIVVQHTGGLTRWWDAQTASVLGEDRSAHATERKLLGLRQGSTRALFMEQPRFRELSLVERALVDGARREVWSAVIATNNEYASISALGESHAIVELRQSGSRVKRAVLVSRDSATTPLLDGDEHIQGRLLFERDEVVLERITPTTPGADTCVWRRERIATDGARLLLDARTIEVRGGSRWTNAGLVCVDRNRARFVSHDGAIAEHAWSGYRELACARDVQRAVACTKDDYESVCVVDARLGEIARWRAIDEDDAITALAMSDDGTAVAVGTASGQTLVFCERDVDSTIA